MPAQLQGYKTDVLNRSQQALQQLMVGEPSKAWSSMLDSGDLTPKQRDAFLKEYDLDKSPYAPLYRLMTHPVLILSLALNYKFPVASAKNLFRSSNKIKAMLGKFPWIGRLGSMQTLFRGTGVPETVGGIARDMDLFRSRFGEQFRNLLHQFKNTTGRLPNHKEQIMVGAWLDGLHRPLRGYQGQAGKILIGKGQWRKSLDSVGTLLPNLERSMTQPLQDFGGGIRGLLDDMWKEGFGSVKARRRIAETIARMKKTGHADEMTATMEYFIKNPKKMVDYFPHRLVRSEEDFQRLLQIMTDSASVKKFAGSAQARSLRWVESEAYKRRYAMAPSATELAELGPLVDQTQLKRLEEVTKAQLLSNLAATKKLTRGSLLKLKSMPLRQIEETYPQVISQREAGEVMKVLSETKPLTYSLKLTPVLSSYMNSMAGTYAWTIRGGGPKMIEHLTELQGLGRSGAIGSAQAKMRAEMLENTYIPMALGRGTFNQVVKAQAWEQNVMRLRVWVDRPEVRKVLGNGIVDTFKGMLESSKGAYSLANLNRSMASYFYLGALGMNPGSAFKNMLQLVLTTGPVVGYGTAIKGFSNVMRKSHKYFAFRLGSQKMSHLQAAQKVWPEFAESGLVTSPITDLVVQNSLENAVRISSLPSGKLATLNDTIKGAMMSFFSASENVVRLSSWEAGMIHGARVGLKTEALATFSARLVEETQFLTGIQNTPYWLLHWQPLQKQLMQFPLRFLEFATSTAWKLGVAEKNWMGINPGTFSRMVAGSIITMELGEKLGLDLKDALIGGALPTFRKWGGGPFGKFPIVPPAAQLLGSFATSLVEGDWADFKQAVPLGVPGGVSLFRVMGLAPDVTGGAQTRVARFFERPYADYNNPTPDGRVPVYTGSGGFKGFYKPWDILKTGLGIKAGDLKTEQELMEVLIRTRDQVRDAKRGYLDARMRNSASEANGIASDFLKNFGFNIPITQKDVEASQLKRHISRLENLVRQMPPGPARNQMIQLIAVSLGASGKSLLGIDPEMLGAPAPQRRAARTQHPGMRMIQSPRGRLSPLAPIDLDTMGQQPYTKMSNFSL